MAKRHLLEVSMGLLGICLVLCLVASLTHSLMPHSWNGQALQNVTNFLFYRTPLSLHLLCLQLHKFVGFFFIFFMRPYMLYKLYRSADICVNLHSSNFH